MVAQQKRRKHNAETIRLAKTMTFTARDLRFNQNGKLTKEQVSELSQHLLPQFAMSFGIMLLGVIVIYLILTGMVDPNTLVSSNRLRFALGLLLLIAMAVSMVNLVKSSMGLAAIYSTDIKVYKGIVKHSQRKTSDETMYFMHFGNVRWRINPDYYGLFQDGYEYTVYYIAPMKAILSVNASRAIASD